LARVDITVASLLNGWAGNAGFFVCNRSGDKFHNLMDKLVKKLKQQNKKIKDIKQLRASVIVNWLKVHNIRKAQYYAGHRYVSSTEAYQANNMDDLKEDVNKYHPLN